MYEGFYLRKARLDPKQREERMARLEEIEAEVCEHAAGILQAFFDFHLVTPNQTEPPEQWIIDYGEKAAYQRLAIAKAGWLPNAYAPKAVDVALKVQTASARARRHTLRLNAANLNVTIGLPAPTTSEHPGPVSYEVRDLEK